MVEIRKTEFASNRIGEIMRGRGEGEGKEHKGETIGGKKGGM